MTMCGTKKRGPGEIRPRILIRRTCPDSKTAEILARSIHSDNEGFAEVSREQGQLSVAMNARNLPELLRGLDDLLSCLDTAERSLATASRTRDETHSAHRPKP